MAKKVLSLKAVRPEEALRQAASILRCNEDDLQVKIVRQGAPGVLSRLVPWVIEFTLDRPDKKKVDDRLETLTQEVLDYVSDLDGFFRLTERPGEGIYLTVLAPKGTGKAVTLEEVLPSLEEVQDLEADLVPNVVDKGLGVPVRIGSGWRKKKCQIKVRISADKLLAELMATGGNHIDRDDVWAALMANRVAGRADRLLVDEIVEKKVIDRWVTVARGEPPVAGKDAVITWIFDQPEQSLADTEARIDFREVRHLPSAKIGDVLAIKIPAEPGRPGIAVTDEVLLPPPGKDCSILVGKNVEMAPDGLSAYAAASGEVSVVDGRVEVERVHRVQGDVDYSIGNIDFSGTVIIHGTIKNGFKVKAEGAVVVGGNIDGADVECGGDLTVSGGIVGRSYAKASGNIGALFVENARLLSKRSILVDRGIMHSLVTVGERVRVTGDPGVIVGGVVRAGKAVDAQTIGSKVGTPTGVQAGFDFAVEEEIEQCRTRYEQSLHHLKKAATALDMAQKLPPPLKEEQALTVIRLEEANRNLQDQVNHLKKGMENLVKRRQAVSGGRITARQYLYPGVRVQIDGQHYQTNSVTNGTSISIVDDRVHLAESG